MHQRKIHRRSDGKYAGHQRIDQAGNDQTDQNQQALDHSAREDGDKTNAQHRHYRHPAVER
ncbi:hypothetical protein D3C78_1551070 [compost metagenome]